MKRIQDITVYMIMGIVILLMQIHILNNMTFFGAKVNLVLIYVTMTAVFKDIKWSISTSIVMGIIIDIVFKAPLLKYVAIYIIISIIMHLTISKYRKESKLAIIYIIGIATIIFEVIEYIFYAITKGTFVNMFSFIGMVIISIIINIVFGIFLHKVYSLLEIRQTNI